MFKYLYIIILLASCTKQQKLQQQTQEKHFGGLLPDDPIEVAKVPLIVSSSFINTVAAKGKPVTNISFVSPADQSTVTGTVLIKTSVTSTISIDGVQVSSTGSYNWNTATASKGYHILTAQVKGTKVSITVFIETIIIDPPADTVIVTGKGITMPPVINQGSEGSCVAMSVGYAARSAEWYYKTGATTYSNATNVFSPEFLYNQVKFSSDCYSGTAMQTALDLIVTKGICTFQSMPYSTSNGCSILPNDQQSAEAHNYKIDGYYKIYTSDRAAIKSMVDAKHPVIISIVTDFSFDHATAGYVWKFGGNYSLPHSVVICGYDDAKNAWKIQNSWGTSWGDAGYSYIDYDFFPTRTGTWCYAIN